MKSRGVLFTVLIVLFIVSIVLLRQSIEDARNDELSASALYNALDNTSSKMANLQRTIIQQNKFGYNKAVDERSLPFQYDWNDSAIQINQLLPVKGQVWFNYFDLINGFQVFVSDENFSNGFDALPVQAGTIQNEPWGGSAEKLRFLIQPQCLRYEVWYDANKLDLVKWGGKPKEPDCAEDFNIQSISRIDVNLEIFNSAEDFNTVTYDFNEPFDPANPYPFFNILVIDSNCSGCHIPSNQKNVSGHVRASQPNRVRVTCNGVACSTSKDIVLTIGEDMNLLHDGRQFRARWRIQFKEWMEQFYLLDFNLSVQNRDFNITQRIR